MSDGYDGGAGADGGGDMGGGAFDFDGNDNGGGITGGAADFGDVADGMDGDGSHGGGITGQAAEVGDVADTDGDSFGGGMFGQAAEMAGGGHGHGHDGGHGMGGGHSSHCGFSFGAAGVALACMGLSHTGEDLRCGRRVRLPGLAWNDRAVQVLAWPHGEVNVAQVLKELALKHGLYNLARRKPDLIDAEEVIPELIDTTPFDGTKFNSPMPSGWYPGATGFTRTYKQFGQLGSRRWWWSDIQLDLTSPVHLMCQSATWYFNETGDYETRMAFVVKSKGELKAGKWVHRKDLIRTHLLAAKVLSDGILTALKAAQPTSSAVIQRKLITASRAYATTPAVKPKKPAKKAKAPAPKVGDNSGPPAGADPMTFDMTT